MTTAVKIKDSPRLTYRLLGKDDAHLLWQLDQDPDVMHFINGGKPSDMATINDVLIPRMQAYLNPKKGWGIWQVCDNKTQEYLGWVLARPMNFFSDAPNVKDLELGWRFFKKHWSKGYATEAATVIKDALACQTDINFVSALAVEDNIGSIAVMKKVGMSFVRKYNHSDPIGDFIAVHYQMSVK